MPTSGSESTTQHPPSPELRHFYDSTTALKEHAVAILASFHDLIDRELVDSSDRPIIIQMLTFLQYLAEQDMEIAIQTVLGPEVVEAIREELARNDAAAQTNGAARSVASVEHR